MSAEKVRENRLRRAALRQGLMLQKSKRRDPRALDYGGFMLIDIRANNVVAGAEPIPFSLTLDEVEAWLTR